MPPRPARRPPRDRSGAPSRSNPSDIKCSPAAKGDTGRAARAAGDGSGAPCSLQPRLPTSHLMRSQSLSQQARPAASKSVAGKTAQMLKLSGPASCASPSGTSPTMKANVGMCSPLARRERRPARSSPAFARRAGDSPSGTPRCPAGEDLAAGDGRAQTERPTEPAETDTNGGVIINCGSDGSAL